MPVSIHFDESLETSRFSSYRQPLSNEHGGLHLAFLPAATIARYLDEEMLRDHNVIIAQGYHTGSGSSKGTLYSNMALNAQVASTEDIAPTILSALGCDAPVHYYSTGQSLLSPSRNWLVSTSVERIVVFHDGKRTDVLSNGSYEITETATNKRSNAPLNVDLLSRAIMHLSRFSKQN
jgi:phosphoglycerol transferase MdoB-like AlkP superfamily enzyme